MKILVINSGSSSIKYKLISMKKEEVLAKGLIEKIGSKDALLEQKTFHGKKYKDAREILNHEQGISLIIEMLLNGEYGVLKNINEIDGIGHRVLHGGDKFSNPVLITEEVKDKIRECIPLGPLHNPNNLKGIEAMEKVLPNVKQVATFDTAFHQSMPDYAYIYGIPYKFYQEEKIRRYGFHGSSHRYVSEKAIQTLDNKKNLKIITCHLGNGGSLCAIKDGKCIDTSMGLTPLEGIVMGTRSGDIDPAIIFNIAKKLDMTIQEIDDMLNKYSGILGISGVSNDMRELIKAINENNPRAILAMNVFTYKIKKYIGSYLATLNGADAIVFTGGIGENSYFPRELICKDLENLGIKIDVEKNKNTILGKEGFINKKDSNIKILVLSTDEELVIARDTKDIIN
ncbi:MAG: acetate kinase [Elusimicrobiota bacterium]|nr:acetate kinase [Elusimicrobiota bacterium]